jgi:hypothetical protein
MLSGFVPGLAELTEAIWDESACEEHDLCYSTCAPTVHRKTCDADFKRALLADCDSITDSPRFALYLAQVEYMLTWSSSGQQSGGETAWQCTDGECHTAAVSELKPEVIARKTLVTAARTRCKTLATRVYLAVRTFGAKYWCAAKLDHCACPTP